MRHQDPLALRPAERLVADNCAEVVHAPTEVTATPTRKRQSGSLPRTRLAVLSRRSNHQQA